MIIDHFWPLSTSILSHSNHDISTAPPETSGAGPRRLVDTGDQDVLCNFPAMA